MWLRVHEPSDWVNSMVTVIKPNGKLRICIDPRDLNKAIKREHFPTKTVEEVVARMPNAKIFSVLDASSGFWQIELIKKAQSSAHSIHHSATTDSKGFHLEYAPHKMFFKM